MVKKKSTKPDPPDPPAVLAIIGEVFEETESECIERMLELPDGHEVKLYIDSSGGSVYAALALAEMIRYKQFDATAIVLSEYSSATLLVFAACKKRYVARHASFLFHRVKWRSEKDLRSEEASNWAEHFQWLEKIFDAKQADLFHIDPEILRTWITQARFVLASELVDLGVAKYLE